MHALYIYPTSSYDKSQVCKNFSSADENTNFMAKAKKKIAS